MADIIELIYADHDWFRRQFFLLDEARTKEELVSVWEPLATKLDTHAEAEETLFYPELLKVAKAADDPVEETDDAVGDHNDIRDAIERTRHLEVGSDAWHEAVYEARSANGEHLDEEEREGMMHFIKRAPLELRHELGLKWAQFWTEHPMGQGIDNSDTDVEEYLQEHTP